MSIEEWVLITKEMVSSVAFLAVRVYGVWERNFKFGECWQKYGLVLCSEQIRSSGNPKRSPVYFAEWEDKWS